MKKTLIVLLIVAIAVSCALGFAACGKKSTLVGYDIELAEKTVEYLNRTYKTDIKVEFIEIDWDQKETLLENGSIDLVWNGMTINAERLEGMSMSIPYLTNKQAIIILKKDKSKYDLTSLDAFMASASNAIVSVESGSAAEDVMLDKDGNKIDAAPHAQQIVKIKLQRPAEIWSLIRTAKAE